MIIENFLYKSINKNDEVKQCNVHKMKFFTLVLAKILSIVIAIYLAWECNKNNKSIMFKILIILISLLFSDFYILFYLIYRVILKNKC